MAAKLSERMKRLGREITRRHMPQTIGAYLVAIITILTAADLVFPGLQISDDHYRLLVIVLIAGIPLVTALSWFYDITSHGIVRTFSGESLAPTSGFVAAGSSSKIESVAILPFVNTSADAEGEYLSDGITETIINKLANVGEVRVIPRASAFRYKGTQLTPAEICQQLKVQTSVTGSVNHYGEHLVVQAELVDPAQESQIWGERFNARWANLFEVQEEIATRISESLKPTLSREECNRLQQRETEHLDAYQDYLRGRFSWNKRTAEDVLNSITHFRRALEKDPQYAMAYTGLGDAYNILGYYGVAAPDDSFPMARIADEQALRLQPGLAQAHASLGYCTLFYDRDWEEARSHFERAMELDPNYGNAHQWYAWYLMVVERYDEALASFQEALRLDPLSQIINDHLALGYMLTGQMTEARRQIERTRSLDPNYSLVLWRLGDWYMAEGDPAEAARVYSEVEHRRDGRFTLGYEGLALALAGQREEAEEILVRMDDYARCRHQPSLDRALVHAGLGNLDECFEHLAVARDSREADMVRLKLLPWPDAVREDARFAAMVRQLGLPQ